MLMPICVVRSEMQEKYVVCFAFDFSRIVNKNKINNNHQSTYFDVK